MKFTLEQLQKVLGHYILQNSMGDFYWVKSEKVPIIKDGLWEIIDGSYELLNKEFISYDGDWKDSLRRN